MKYQASDFLALRTLILKNSIFNSLLASQLLKSYSMPKVGMTLVKADEIKDLLIKERGKNAKLPKYVMVDIVAKASISFAVGYSYKGHVPSQMNYLSIPANSHILGLKFLSSTIFDTHSIVAAKSDKIFSASPKSLNILLECAGVSSNCWKSGFSKKHKEMNPSEICETELIDYYTSLNSRLSEWRFFNNALIALIKEKKFETTNAYGDRLTILEGPLNDTVLVTVYSCVDDVENSILLNYSDLNPTSWLKCWSKASQGVDAFALKSFFLTNSQS